MFLMSVFLQTRCPMLQHKWYTVGLQQALANSRVERLQLRGYDQASNLFMAKAVSSTSLCHGFLWRTLWLLAGKGFLIDAKI